MRRYALVLLFVIVGAARAAAAPITVTETFTGTGFFNGSFYSALVTLTLEGDTDDVADTGLFLLPGVATVDVAGSGSATFTDDIQAVVNPVLGRGGFGDFTNNLGLLFIDHAAFLTYDLSSSIGPLSGPASFNSGASFPIDLGGGFSIVTIDSDVSYRAVVASVPEPASLALLGTGVLVLFRRRAARNR